MADTCWLTHTQALGHCNLKAHSRVLYRAAKHQDPKYRLRSAKLMGTGELRFKREWLDEWLQRMADPVGTTAA